MAQKVFGSAVGVGTCKMLNCSLKHRGASAQKTDHHQMSYTDSMNIVPFEDAAYKSVR
jgi:hypothetical protein